MASNPPGACCFQGFKHEGTPVGKYEELFGLETYVTGSSKENKYIVILGDVFGIKLANCLLIADQLAQSGYTVLYPDILNGDIVDIDNKASVDFAAWIAKHDVSITKPIVDSFMSKVKETYKPKFLGVIGYCFGAKYVIQQLNKETGLADCGAIAHPSFVTMDEVAVIDKPLLISAAENDHIFPSNLRHDTEDKLKELGVRYQIDLFGGVSHGFAARGDPNDPVVKYAKEKALLDQIYWFNYFSGITATKDSTGCGSCECKK
ncbi:probable Protein AIM2 [Saccharomycodes ludwigii]|uniref:Probable Protein AIM2 n=1 Tax=Saccharomycodes ludwigii TaxID=36035 RepID=A0A376B6Q4_9ASCO|nr:hypothetical protein SCDLUD_004946 [Saccharomycodes ludwigii]KAH3899501.1 hypothetical protein SCDLUD_004946 [Saccharomycodes ludwigii]SSD60365.1 probable Protein AIM2 [Saccharomycodes ludwigii]